jgi:hypothetical protein
MGYQWKKINLSQHSSDDNEMDTTDTNMEPSIITRSDGATRYNLRRTVVVEAFSSIMERESSVFNGQSYRAYDRKIRDHS